MITEKRLQEIEDRVKAFDDDNYFPNDLPFLLTKDIPAPIAEVRRLQEENKHLRYDAHYYREGYCAETPADFGIIDEGVKA